MTIPEQEPSPQHKELVAVGAGAGCQPCLSHHLKAGATAGLDGEQLGVLTAWGETFKRLASASAPPETTAQATKNAAGPSKKEGRQ